MPGRKWPRPPKTGMLCRICNQVKTEGEFHPSNWKGAITRSKCRDCITAYQNDPKRYQEVKVRVESRRQKRMNVVNALKAERGCVTCGESHPAALDFHHRDPMQKVMGIGTLVASTTNMDRVLSEIRKCDVICSNCHRKLHWQKERPRRKKAPQQQRVEAQQALRLA